MPSWLTVKPLLWLSGGLFVALLAMSVAATVMVSRANTATAKAETKAADAKTELAEIRADIADQRETFERLARATEQRHTKALADVSKRYEQEKADVEAHAAGVAAGLRDGTVRLRHAWAGCESARLSADAGAIGAVAEQDRLRRESLQRVLGWVGQLQAERNECVDGWAGVTVMQGAGK